MKPNLGRQPGLSRKIKAPSLLQKIEHFENKLKDFYLKAFQYFIHIKSFCEINVTLM